MAEHCPSQTDEEALTPAMRNTLGDLALKVEEHAVLADAFTQVIRRLEFLVDRHPEFQGCSAELRVKLGQLEDLHKKASRTIMSYAHTYEDACSAPETS